MLQKVNHAASRPQRLFPYSINYVMGVMYHSARQGIYTLHMFGYAVLGETCLGAELWAK